MSRIPEGIHALAQIRIEPPIVGGMISGAATLIAAGVVTWRLNRGIKREFVLAFTQRYHLAMNEKHRLNKGYIQAREIGPPAPSVVALEAMEAKSSIGSSLD